MSRDERDIYHSAACRAAAAKGKIHPAKLDLLLSDLRRLPSVSADARDTTHLWAWRRLNELRNLVTMAPATQQAMVMDLIIGVLLEVTGFAERGRELVTEHRDKWQQAHDLAEEQIQAGMIKEWPEGLKEYPYDEPA